MQASPEGGILELLPFLATEIFVIERLSCFGSSGKTSAFLMIVYFYLLLIQKHPIILTVS